MSATAEHSASSAKKRWGRLGKMPRKLIDRYSSSACDRQRQSVETPSICANSVLDEKLLGGTKVLKAGRLVSLISA